MRAAASWLRDELADLGFDAAVMDTPGHPMVVARTPAGEGRSLLFYGHYDVQPVDPLELWNRPPFDPAVEDTPNGPVIRGRGAADDKGQLMTFVEACRAWKAVHGALPPGLILLFEGEEESGSTNLQPFLRENAGMLRADLALICDTSLYADGRPAITTQLRGLMGEEIVVRAADRDLHSGMFGGPLLDATTVMVRLLATLHDADGAVAVEGLVRAPEPELDYDEADFRADAGVGEEALSRLRSPIGLDLGAGSPAEVAVAILAEILAVRAERRTVEPLRDGSGPLHARTAASG